MSLAQKVALVTGGARGIGLACARLLASRGAAVCVCDVSLDGDSAAGQLREAHPSSRATFVPCDVSDRGSVDACIAKVVETYGRLDWVVANAGIVKAAPFLESMYRSPPPPALGSECSQSTVPNRSSLPLHPLAFFIIASISADTLACSSTCSTRPTPNALHVPRCSVGARLGRRCGRAGRPAGMGAREGIDTQNVRTDGWAGGQAMAVAEGRSKRAERLD